MENEIKVGDWIRTDNGIIGKYVKYRGIEDAIETNNKWIGFDIEKDIVKHSPELINLIQCGDYVNGRLVLQVDYKNQNICLLIPLTDTKANTNIMWYGYEDIKTIVTKEQFESISYKVDK